MFNDSFAQIALHSKAEPGRFSTDRAHLSDRKISGVERGAQWLLDKTVHIGPYTYLWAKTMLDERGIEGVRVLQGFIGLTQKYKPRQIERASRTALQANLFRLRPLRELIKRTEDQTELEFAQSHEIIRPLSQYQQLLTLISRKPKEETR